MFIWEESSWSHNLICSFRISDLESPLRVRRSMSRQLYFHFAIASFPPFKSYSRIESVSALALSQNKILPLSRKNKNPTRTFSPPLYKTNFYKHNAAKGRRCSSSLSGFSRTRQGESVHPVINIYETDGRVEGGKKANLSQSTRHWIFSFCCTFQLPLLMEAIPPFLADWSWFSTP